MIRFIACAVAALHRSDVRTRPRAQTTAHPSAHTADVSRRGATTVALLAACGPGEAPRAAAPPAAARPPAVSPAAASRAASWRELPVSVRAGALHAPDTVAAGWTRLRVEEETGGGHIVVLYALPRGAADTDVPAFLTALDGAATPAGAVALGGPEVGDSGQVIVELTPGRYLLGCVRRGDDGHRHATSGEARLLVVPGDATPHGRAEARPAVPLPPPMATQEVRMADFTYLGPDRWLAGRHVLAVRNSGAQDHQLRLARLRPGATLREWMDADDPRQVATDLAGVARLGAGRVAYLPIELPAGEYVVYCLVPDARSGRPHLLLGMMRAIHVR